MTAWWGSREVTCGSAHLWCVGPLTLEIQNLSLEWRALVRRGSDPLDETLEERDLSSPTGDEPPEGTETLRFAHAEPIRQIVLTPLLPDRPVVCSPHRPLYLPARGRTVMFISTPVWIRLTLDSADLCEVPSFRLSDTWFGDNTREGELCYATRTAARLDRDKLPKRPHRALSEVEIRNESSEALLIDKIKMPVTTLSLYARADGLWTDRLNLVRTDEQPLTRVDVDARRPDETPLTGPRRQPEAKLSRVFSTILRS